MKKQSIPQPTETELKILRLLWQRGPSTVRDIYKIFSREKEIAYTTVLKLMQIMADKGLVRRDESQRAHIYHAVLDEAGMQKQLIADLVDWAFGGSEQRLLLQLLSSKESAEAIAEVRQLLDAVEARRAGQNFSSPGGVQSITPPQRGGL
jgi:predicted transcriptional regulator